MNLLMYGRSLSPSSARTGVEEVEGVVEGLEAPGLMGRPEERGEASVRRSARHALATAAPA